MALWSQTQQLTGYYLGQIQELYSTPRFPIDVRHSIAEWLELQDWKAIDDNQDEALALYMLEQMEKQIQEKASFIREDSFPHRLRLMESANGIKRAYQDNPLELVRLIRDCLMREKQLVMMSCGEPLKQENQVSQTEWNILSEMGTLRKAVMDAGNLTKDLQQKHESFVLFIQNKGQLEERLNRLNKHPESAQKQQQKKIFEHDLANLRNTLTEAAEQLRGHRQMMVAHMKNIIGMFQNLSHMIFDVELVSWKGLQKQATFKSDLCEGHLLNKIQKWCEEFASLLNDCKQQVMKLQLLETVIPLGQQDINELNLNLTELLKCLLLKSFVVDRHPPQVVRKDARFAACVRLLVGHKLNVFMTMPMVEAIIISEPQARQIVKDGYLPPNMDNAGDLLNHKCSMEYTQAQMSVNFKNMQLKKIKRADRKGQELVVEEKFCILFRAKIQADREYETWTMSMPVVVTVHGNQECQAKATILWDNAFSEPNRIPFVVPDQVLWKDLATLLSCWFHHTTGAGLTLDHLQYLAAKLFGEGVTDYSNNQVSRSQFHKDHLAPGKWNFTFWEWLYLVQKLNREFLRQLWLEGLIMGFVSKKHAQDLLMARPPGTFLLRFSDTELGGISIVYNCIDSVTEKTQVHNLSPFTDKDFRIRCLADRVKDLTVLCTLYPDIPKESAFGKYWSSSNDSVQQANPLDYIPHTLSMTVPGMRNPNTGGPPMSPASTIVQPMSNMTMNSMDMSDYPDDLSSYLSPAPNNDFTHDDLADVMINRYLT